MERDGGRLAERCVLHGQAGWQVVQQPLGHGDGLGQSARRVDAEQPARVAHVGFALATARAAAAPDDRLRRDRVAHAVVRDVGADLAARPRQTRAQE